jgi:ATP-binding cassette subfamily F protein 3
MSLAVYAAAYSAQVRTASSYFASEKNKKIDNRREVFMIKVENLSYGVPAKDLYKNISFTIEDGRHCAFIGRNGTGKTTLVDMLMDPEKYLYDGRIIRDEHCRIGYISQFVKHDKDRETTVFEYLSERFRVNQEETAAVCAEMAEATDLEPVFERYQRLLDEFQAMDGDHYEVNIRRQLYDAQMTRLEQTPLSALSGGEFKLLQVMKEMLMKPTLLVMDEPDAFLDFENLSGLANLINHYSGTLLVVTHSRYLLNHCFDQILQLEDTDIQEFDGNYAAYTGSILEKKIELQEQAAKDQEEIERNEKMVERLRANATRVDNASLGRAVHAKDTQLQRLIARQIKAPFVDIREPAITFPQVDSEPQTEEPAEVLLRVNDYRVAFDEVLLDHVSFELHAGEKVAIVGANGTGKTTLLRDIFHHTQPSISYAPNAEVGFLSQIYGEMLDEAKTVYEEFDLPGLETKAAVRDYLAGYGFEEATLNQRIGQLSGGEKNLLQLAKIALGHANLLLLDEPVSHLDLYAQIAMEKAMAQYKGAVLMVSHDFYNIVNCVDSVLYVEDGQMRPMRIRTFRQRMYEKHFSREYLEEELKRKELETKIAACLKKNDIENAKTLCKRLNIL